MNDNLPTAEELRERFHYDPETGIVTNKKTGNVLKARTDSGYLMLWFGGRTYYIHRVVWVIMTGAWPRECIDHKNGVRDDNRWSNLREASYGENKQNEVLRKDSTTGLKGVSFHKAAGKYRSYIRLNGKQKHLGLFPTPEEAHEAYCREAQKHFGEFFRAA